MIMEGRTRLKGGWIRVGVKGWEEGKGGGRNGPEEGEGRKTKENREGERNILRARSLVRGREGVRDGVEDYPVSTPPEWV